MSRSDREVFQKRFVNVPKDAPPEFLKKLLGELLNGVKLKGLTA
jgi:hypothetical protein